MRGLRLTNISVSSVGGAENLSGFETLICFCVRRPGVLRGVAPGLLRLQG
jgi:hypothetical protein